MFKRICILILFNVTPYLPLHAQELKLTLWKAIELAKKSSFDYQVAANRYQSSLWDYRSFRASFLPIFKLNGTIPNYNRKITRITLPSGEDTFVKQNQAFSALDLSVTQRVAATGGSLSLISSVNRLDVFGNNRLVNYSLIPFSISYSQESISYNSFKWDRRIANLTYNTAKVGLITDLEEISSQTINYYFEMLSVQAAMNLSQQNLASTDTLYNITKERMKLGTAGKSELLQLRLNVLSAETDLRSDSSHLVLSRQQLSRYISIPADEIVSLSLPDDVRFFKIDYIDALSYAKQNSKSVLNFRLQRLTAEKALAEAKSEQAIKFNIGANIGISNTASNLAGLRNNFENQQNLILGFSLPLIDWGLSKTKRSRAKADVDIIENQISQNNLAIEQEVALQLSKWELVRKQISATKEAKEIAIESYDMEKQRYLTGSISLNDLNLARNQKDVSVNNYISAIRSYWDLYFIIRKITLFDFDKNEKINVTY